jgi:hypothetical protein
MPRSIKLSWQPGSRGKPGYWKKFYKGKVYYFPSGTGKSDMRAYGAAWDTWLKKKVEIDATTPRKHQADYEQCILGWEKVLAWSSKYEDGESANQAENKLMDLRRRFAAVKLTPLVRNDWFEALFDSPFARDPEFAAQVEIGLEHFSKLPPRQRIESYFGPPDQRTPEVTDTIEKLIQVDQLLRELASSRQNPGPRALIHPLEDAFDNQPRRIRKAIWDDRLTIQDRKAAHEDESLVAHIKTFLSRKETESITGDLSAGRLHTLDLHLNGFKDWYGADTSVKEIDGAVLQRYKDHLLKRVASGKWRRATAAHCLDSVKSLVRWLYETNAITELPRALVIKSTSLVISKPKPSKVTFEKDEITTLLKDATDRMKLYILLSLNCSMTQKDIGDLLVSEVRWNEGRIIRKRSKTQDEENVPEVNYKLWPKTFQLLKQERAKEGNERVLLNNRGGHLWSEGTGDNGKYAKRDSIRLAFGRLLKKTKLSKSFKSLKKKSASLLKNNVMYSGLTGLFLGHAPRSVADKHYAETPQELLDEAVTWLGQEYGLVKRSDAPKSTDSSGPSSNPAPNTASADDASQSAVEVQSDSNTPARSPKAARRRPAAKHRRKGVAASAN